MMHDPTIIAVRQNRRPVSGGRNLAVAHSGTREFYSAALTYDWNSNAAGGLGSACSGSRAGTGTSTRSARSMSGAHTRSGRKIVAAIRSLPPAAVGSGRNADRSHGASLGLISGEKV